MNTFYLKTKKLLKDNVKEVVRKVFRFQPGYEFYPARSIQKQSVSFLFHGRTLTIEADHTTPLYDTISEVVDYDCYQLSEVKFSGDARGIVVDIGAHIGVAAVVMAQLHPGRMVCFEPFPRNCELLRANLKLNGVDRAEVRDAAVTDTDGAVEFEVNPGISVIGHVTRTVRGDPLAFTQKFQVPSVSLCKALAPFPDAPIELIKMDCEGGEYAIVEQIGPDLAGRIKNMTFEVHDLDRQRNVSALSERLESLGYQVRYKKEMYNRLGLHHLLASR